MLRRLDVFGRERPRTPEGSDFYKRMIDTATLLVIIGGLYFAWDQAKQFNPSQNLANWSDVTARTFDIDKVFIDNPEMQKYFFDSVDIQNLTKTTPRRSL